MGFWIDSEFWYLFVVWIWFWILVLCCSPLLILFCFPCSFVFADFSWNSWQTETFAYNLKCSHNFYSLSSLWQSLTSSGSSSSSLPIPIQPINKTLLFSKTTFTIVFDVLLEVVFWFRLAPCIDWKAELEGLRCRGTLSRKGVRDGHKASRTSNRTGRTGSVQSRINIPRRHSNVSEPTSIRSLTSDSKGNVFNNGILKEYLHAGL